MMTFEPNELRLAGALQPDRADRQIEDQEQLSESQELKLKQQGRVIENRAHHPWDVPHR